MELRNNQAGAETYIRDNKKIKVAILYVMHLNNVIK